MSFGVGIGDFLAVLKLAGDIRRRWVDAPPEYASMRDEIKNVENILRDIDDLKQKIDLDPGVETKLRHACDVCWSVLRDCIQIADKYSAIASSSEGSATRRRWTRLKLDPDDIRRARDRLSSFVLQLTAVRDTIHTNLLHEIENQAHRINKTTIQIREDTQDLRNRIEIREKREIADWYSSPKFADLQNEYSRQRKQGTGQWFFRSDEYYNWSRRDQFRPVLLCPGIPGGGKTMLVAAIIDNLVDHFEGNERVAIIYFYCNYNRKDEQNLDQIYSCLIRQLFEMRPSPPAEVKSLYEKYRHHHRRPSTDELLRLLHYLIGLYEKVFVLVDALDECNTEQNCRVLLLNELHHLSQDQPQREVRILLTTRPIIQVIEKFSNCPQLFIRAHDEDIAHYLNARMPEIGCVSRKADLQEEIQSQIIKLADGMFLLARLHFDSLLGFTKPRAIRQALDQLPKGDGSLFKAYETARERIDHQLKPQRDLAHRVLGWVALAYRELHIDELLEAIAIEPGMTEFDHDNDMDDEQSITAVCAGLVTVDVETCVVRLVHYTTQEYLEKVQNEWLSCNETEIAYACLTYLSMDVLRHQNGTSTDNTLDRFGKYKFLPYAGDYWGDHARNLDDITQVFEFLRDEMNVWSANSAMQLARHHQFGNPRFSRSELTNIDFCAYFNLWRVYPHFVESGTSFDLRNRKRRTSLTWAATRGHTEMTKLLLRQPGTDVNSTDEAGVPPLMHAVHSLQTETIKLLLEQPDIDVNFEDLQHATSFLYAIESGHMGIIKLLLEHPDIEINFKDEYDTTPLMYAIESGRMEVIKLLLEQPDIDVNSKDRYGRSTLMYAIDSKRTDSVDVLDLVLGKPAIDVNSGDNFGCTPLLSAVENQHVRMVEILLRQSNIDVNSRDQLGQTPLLEAVVSEHAKIVELLLEHPEVDTSLKDGRGRTALALAVVNGLTDVVMLLEKHQDTLAVQETVS